MALPSRTLEVVKAMSAKQRTEYFEQYARYIPDAPMYRYSILVGSTTLHSNDTQDLRKKFDRLLKKRLN